MARRPESLYESIYGHISSDRDRTKRAQNLETGLGFFGFFSLMSLITLVAAEVQGQPALLEAVVAALFCSMTFVLYRRWRRLGR